ncbi:MAG TPA: hypothetical protein EYQ54_03670 [Myxococcales bacterium]|nr:hypothetical protein [Myxococcales bacterium]
MQEAIRRRSSTFAGVPPPPTYTPPKTFVPKPPAEAQPVPRAEESARLGVPSPAPVQEKLPPYRAARAAGAARAARAARETTLAASAISSPPPEPAASRKKPHASGFQEVRVLSTTWHPAPEKRIAVVSASADGALVELRQGDLWNRLRVNEIKLSSVIFGSGDEEIVRKVGTHR